MNKNISAWQFWGFIFTVISGVLLHFLYEWTNYSPLAAVFSATNESTWEHMKLLYMPMLLFAAVEYKCLGEEYNNFWCIKLRGMLLGLITIPVIFYTYNGVFGKSPDWVNITIFFVAAVISYIYETKRFNDIYMPCLSVRFSVTVLLILAILFVIFTFYPPKLPIFQDFTK